MKKVLSTTLILLATLASVAQTASSEEKVVIVTGARFSYPLVQRWIDEYARVNSHVQVVIESRGSSDPAKFDVLAEVYEQDAAVKATREYVHVGRYAVLPVASAQSQFASVYGERGLTRDLIRQIYFRDLFADSESAERIRAPFTVYTRMQKAGVPLVFARYFGFEQKDINGKGIAGSDEHLVKAILRDSTGISYLPLPLIYNHATGKTIDGLAVLPVDLDGNNKLGDDERIFSDFRKVIDKLEATPAARLKNVPVEYLHLSVNKNTASQEAIAFVQWVSEHGQEYLHEYGYLNPEEGRSGKERFGAFASGRAQR